MLKKTKNRKGFTLIELIVVIAILGILAAIMIPRFGGFQDRARQSQAVVDAKQIATAIDGLNAETNAWPISAEVTVTMVDDLSGVKTDGVTTNALFFDGSGGFTYAVKVNGKWYIAGRDGTGPVKAHSTSPSDVAPTADLDDY